MFGLGKRTPRRFTVEEQLVILAEVGIRIRPDRSLDEMLGPEDRGVYEEEPFRLLLACMGGELENPPWERYYSDDIWYFDTECIEDHGAYAHIVNRLASLTKGSLVIDEVRDFVDVESGEAWVEVRIKGELFRYEPEVQDDWVDPGFLTWFASISSRHTTPKNFTFHHLGGQDGLIGFATPDQLRAICKRTGLHFTWLR